MDKETKKIMIYTLLGVLFGITCAYMATIRKPVPITEWVLLSAVYNRTLIGISLYLLKPFKKKISKWIIAVIAGFSISLAMSLGYGISGIGFAIIGAVYAVVIEAIASKLLKN